jgi:hypothetical protein
MPDLPAVITPEDVAVIPEPWDRALIDRILDLKVGYGMVRFDAICRRLNEHEDADAQIPMEVVRDCMHSAEFKRAQDMAQSDPMGWAQKRFRDVQRITRHRMEVDALASKSNADKRTRTANLHFALGLAGFTPQTQVAVGPDQNFVDFIGKMLTSRNGDAAGGR